MCLNTRKWNTLAFTVSTGVTSARKYLAVSALPGAADEPPCPGEGYAGVAASTRGLQALATKAALSLPALEPGLF